MNEIHLFTQDERELFFQTAPTSKTCLLKLLKKTFGLYGWPSWKRKVYICF